MVDQNALSRVIVALDNMSATQIRSFLKQTQGRLSFVKIGLETFCRYGRDFVTEIKDDYHCDIFLDLKLHDIPNTVAKAVNALEGLPVKFLTVHLSGGIKMLEQALEQQKLSLPKTQLLGVSYLTSLDEADFQNIWGIESAQISGQFEKLFRLAHQTNLGGIVCSPHEAKILRELEKSTQAPRQLLVCPGVRFQDEIDSGTGLQDQKRILSPSEALAQGIDYLVMGRPLTQAKNLEQRLDQLAAIKL